MIKPAPDLQKMTEWRKDLHIDFALNGHALCLHSTWGLFSPEKVDEGSQLLLRHTQVAADAEILDLGCGYGVLGLHLAQCAPQGRALLVDKDFVAVEYAKKNAALNQLRHAEVQLSNGLQHIDPLRQFDLIVSNLPAKASKEQHYLFLHDSQQHLKPGGRLVMVVILGLKEFMARTFREIFGNYTKVHQGPAYVLGCATKPDAP